MILERTEDPRVVRVSEVLTQEECSELVKVVEAQGAWKTGIISSKYVKHAVQEEHRNCKEVWLDNHEELHVWNDKLNLIYDKIGWLYSQEVIPLPRELNIERQRVVRYQDGEYIRMHVDEYAPVDGQWRQISVVLSLSECEGGQVFFPKQGLSLSPVVGSALVFPVSPDYVHEALPPTSGSKYVVLSWISANEDKRICERDLSGNATAIPSRGRIAPGNVL